jgi:peptidylprolyl isomerase
MFKRFSLIFFGILCLSILLVTGCGGAKVVENGDSVKVDYTGTLSDGTVFDSSIGKTPLEFTVGAGQMIAGFDKAVLGMKKGETKKVTIPADEAYGQRNETLVQVVNKSQLAAGMNPKVGDQLQSSNGTVVTVTATTDTTITVDANPPMAGKDLTFEITLVELTKKAN